MNRTERRAKEKAKKKDSNKKVEALAWFRSLPPIKRTLVDSLVKLEAEKINNNTFDAIDRCFATALFQEIDFLEYDEAMKIIDISTEVMLDDANKIKELKEKFGGSYDMAIKKINELSPKVEERIRELITEGYNQKLTIKAIAEEFKELSTAMITTMYKKTKGLMKEEEKLKKLAEQEDVSDKTKDITEEVDKEIEDALEYIFEEDNVETKNKANTEAKEVGQANTSKIDEKITTKENNKDKKVSKLKVIKEVTKVISRDVEGQYGIYHIEGNVVNINNEYAFTNTDEVKNWASETRKELAEKLEKIKTEIRHINMCEAEALEVIETYM